MLFFTNADPCLKEGTELLLITARQRGLLQSEFIRAKQMHLRSGAIRLMRETFSDGVRILRRSFEGSISFTAISCRARGCYTPVALRN